MPTHIDLEPLFDKSSFNYKHALDSGAKKMKFKNALELKLMCSGERDVVLHIPYLEMSDRDQMSSTFTEFRAVLTLLVEYSPWRFC